MSINIDINIKASEDIANAFLTLVAVLHNAVLGKAFKEW